MNKKELVSAVAGRVELSAKEVEAVIDHALAVVEKELVEGHEVKVSGFGSMVVKGRAARVGTNPATGAKIEIPASKTVAFKAAKGLKEKVN